MLSWRIAAKNYGVRNISLRAPKRIDNDVTIGAIVQILQQSEEISFRDLKKRYDEARSSQKDLKSIASIKALWEFAEKSPDVFEIRKPTNEKPHPYGWNLTVHLKNQSETAAGPQKKSQRRQTTKRSDQEQHSAQTTAQAEHSDKPQTIQSTLPAPEISEPAPSPPPPPSDVVQEASPTAQPEPSHQNTRSHMSEQRHSPSHDRDRRNDEMGREREWTSPHHHSAVPPTASTPTPIEHDQGASEATSDAPEERGIVTTPTENELEAALGPNAKQERPQWRKKTMQERRRQQAERGGVVRTFDPIPTTPTDDASDKHQKHWYKVVPATETADKTLHNVLEQAFNFKPFFKRAEDGTAEVYFLGHRLATATHRSSYKIATSMAAKQILDAHSEDVCMWWEDLVVNKDGRPRDQLKALRWQYFTAFCNKAGIPKKQKTEDEQTRAPSPPPQSELAERVDKNAPEPKPKPTLFGFLSQTPKPKPTDIFGSSSSPFDQLRRLASRHAPRLGVSVPSRGLPPRPPVIRSSPDLEVLEKYVAESELDKLIASNPELAWWHGRGATKEPPTKAENQPSEQPKEAPEQTKKSKPQNPESDLPPLPPLPTTPPKWMKVTGLSRQQPASVLDKITSQTLGLSFSKRLLPVDKSLSQPKYTKELWVKRNGSKLVVARASGFSDVEAGDAVALRFLDGYDDLVCSWWKSLSPQHFPKKESKAKRQEWQDKSIISFLKKVDQTNREVDPQGGKDGVRAVVPVSWRQVPFGGTPFQLMHSVFGSLDVNLQFQVEDNAASFSVNGLPIATCSNPQPSSSSSADQVAQATDVAVVDGVSLLQKAAAAFLESHNDMVCLWWAKWHKKHESWTAEEKLSQRSKLFGPFLDTLTLQKPVDANTVSFSEKDKDPTRSLPIPYPWRVASPPIKLDPELDRHLAKLVDQRQTDDPNYLAKFRWPPEDKTVTFHKVKKFQTCTASYFFKFFCDLGAVAQNARAITGQVLHKAAEVVSKKLQATAEKIEQQKREAVTKVKKKANEKIKQEREKKKQEKSQQIIEKKKVEKAKMIGAKSASEVELTPSEVEEIESEIKQEVEAEMAEVEKQVQLEEQDELEKVLVEKEIEAEEQMANAEAEAAEEAQKEVSKVLKSEMKKPQNKDLKIDEEQMKDSAKQISIAEVHQTIEQRFGKIIKVEKHFNFRIGDTPVNGCYDKVCERDGEHIVVDVKHGPAEKNMVGRWHEAQLVIYSLAIEHETGKLPQTGAVFFLPSKEVVEVPILPHKVEQMKRTLVEFNEHVREAVYMPQPSRFCNICDYRHICPKGPKTQPEQKAIKH